MGYETIDPTLQAWARRHGLKPPLTEWAGQPARYYYIPGERLEVFQIVVAPPENRHVLINMWSIETMDDTELHAKLSVPIAELDAGLERAMDQIRAWITRERGPDTWTPPPGWEAPA